jgi:hypothetical protein
MMRARSVLASAVLATTLLTAAAVHANGGGSGGTEHEDSSQHGDHGDGSNDAVKVVRRATIGFRRVAAAEAAGYGQFLTCVQEPGQGAMGTHWVNGEFVGDTVLDPTHPEAVMYETKRNGSMELVGVEYIVFQAAWDAEHADPPMLFGEMFHLTAAPNRYGIPAFYALHVWAWKHNPAGTFANWNPKVSCKHAVGTPI